MQAIECDRIWEKRKTYIKGSNNKFREINKTEDNELQLIFWRPKLTWKQEAGKHFHKRVFKEKMLS